MFTVYFSDDTYTCSDASDAVDIYRRGRDAGERASLWRDDELIVHISQCRECGAVVLMTYVDTKNWLAAFAEDLDAVLCESCIDEMLAQENAVVEAELEWDREVEIMLFNSAGIEQ